MVPFQRINGYVAGPGGQNGPSQSIPTPKLVLQLLGRGSIRPEPQNVRIRRSALRGPRLLRLANPAHECHGGNSNRARLATNARCQVLNVFELAL
jgi:hypothetical protein